MMMKKKKKKMGMEAIHNCEPTQNIEITKNQFKPSTFFGFAS